MKIANKISFSFFITALLLIGVAVFAVYGVTRKTVESVMYAHLTSIAQSRCFHIETFLKMKKNTITQLSESVVIKHFLLKDKDDEDYDKGFNDVVQRLKDTREGVEYVHNILVLDKNGIIVVSDEESDIGSDLSADTFFSNAKEGVFIKDVYRSKRAKILSMAFSAPITNNETGEFLGVITEKITIEYLDRIITNRTGLGETGEIYLINKYGYMISSSRFIKDAFLKLEIDTEGTRKASKDIKRFGVEEHGNSPRLYINYNGVKVLGVHDHIHAMQWVLVAEISGKEALESLWKTKFLLTLIMIGVPIWAWLIGVFVAEFTFRPIEKLCKGSVIVGSGNLDYKVGTDSKDEIGQLSRAFDKMIEDLKNVVVPKNYLGDIIESMPEALVVLTPEGKMEKTNKELCDLLGYEDQELIGKDIGFLFSEEEKKIFLKESKFEKFLETGELRGAEANYKTKDGKKIPMIFSGSVMKDKGGKVRSIVCVGKNIIDRKKVENELIQSQKATLNIMEDLQDSYEKIKIAQVQLVQSEKMEAIGKMASGIAHEVKNPLGIILQGINYLEGEVPSNQKDKHEILKIMKDSIKRADSIIRVLLDFSRAGKLEINPEGINLVIESSLVLVEHKLNSKNIEVFQEFEKDMPKIAIDLKKIEQVFVNLFDNAIDAMPDGGKLYIRSYLTRVDDETGNGVGNRSDDVFKCGEKAIIVEIEDTGIGIDEDIENNLFDPFFTTKGRTEGTGLGLSIVKNIMHLHEGLIYAESKKDKGTKFIIVFKLR